jgi:hypothetical protein
MQAVLQEQQVEMESIMLAVFKGELNNSQKDLYKYFLEVYGHLDAYAPQVLVRGSSDNGEDPLGHGHQKLQLRLWQASELQTFDLRSFAYLHAPGTRVIAPPDKP